MAKKGDSTISILLNQGFALTLHGIVLANILRPQNFKEELSFYGAYHQDPINQAIHFVFVPIIVWTAFVWFSYVDILTAKVSVLGHRVTYGTSMYIIYFYYYNMLDKVGGRLFSVVLTLMYLSAARLVKNELASKEKSGPNGKAQSGSKGWQIWQIAALVHVFSWYVQIHPGHAIAEGVKPALLDSLSQALTVAPLFAFYEGVWFMGIATDLQQEVVGLVAIERQRLCAAGGDYPFCSQ